MVLDDDYVANRMAIHMDCTVHSGRLGDFVRLLLVSMLGWLVLQRRPNLMIAFSASFCGEGIGKVCLV